MDVMIYGLALDAPVSCCLPKPQLGLLLFVHLYVIVLIPRVSVHLQDIVITGITHNSATFSSRSKIIDRVSPRLTHLPPAGRVQNHSTAFIIRQDPPC